MSRRLRELDKRTPNKNVQGNPCRFLLSVLLSRTIILVKDNMKSFGLYSEDAQEKTDRKLRIKQAID